MKTRIVIVTLLLGLFIAGTALANEPVPATKAASKAVTEFLANEIDYPAFASENNLECCVSVSVTIQDDGTLKVEAANCGTKCMKEYVVKAIEEAKIEDIAQYAGQNVLLKVSFKLLN